MRDRVDNSRSVIAGQACTVSRVSVRIRVSVRTGVRMTYYYQAVPIRTYTVLILERPLVLVTVTEISAGNCIQRKSKSL